MDNRIVCDGAANKKSESYQTLIATNMEAVRLLENVTLYRAKDCEGEGSMLSYEVFPGVFVNFNNFHMEKFNSQYTPQEHVFCVDHCLEGRLEWSTDYGYIYLGAGNVYVDNRKSHMGEFSFPLHHYHGVTICFDMGSAERSIAEAAPGIYVNLRGVSKKFSLDRPVLLRADTALQNFFANIYQIPKEQRMEYFKTKILELLILLEGLEPSKTKGERGYFSSAVVQKVKKAKEFMQKNIGSRYTQEQLSEKFDIPLTTLKTCFKEIYGDSMYSFVRTMRMNMAATSIVQTKKSITEIAAEIGYDNESKFAAAFRSVIGMTPSQYRKTID